MFLQIVKRRLHALLVAQDGHALSPKNWVFREASDTHSVKRVQSAVTPILARLVSVLDRDRNLDLLLDRNCGEAVRKLWLDMFADESLIDIPYTGPNHGIEPQNLLVLSQIGVGWGVGCALPFSWRVREHLEEVRAQIEHRNDTETQRELFHRYLQDFICMMMKVTSEDELQLLSQALTSCINELIGRCPEASPPSLPWVHVAYQELRPRLHNLHRLLSLLPRLAAPLLRATPTGQMVLDVLAGLACVEHLELPLLQPQAQALQSDAQRIAWLRQVKKPAGAPPAGVRSERSGTLGTEEPDPDAPRPVSQCHDSPLFCISSVADETLRVTVWPF
ncbi:hypothetical protein GJAV_G00142160 [Gymnothorax javanicus]|nr:hypothetical protein GJAV_G00142160 [Gymnothorax javanicus]